MIRAQLCPHRALRNACLHERSLLRRLIPRRLALSSIRAASSSAAAAACVREALREKADRCGDERRKAGLASREAACQLERAQRLAPRSQLRLGERAGQLGAKDEPRSRKEG